MKTRHRRTQRYPGGTVDAARRRLGWMLAVFFIALSAPIYLLTDKVYSQLEQETFYQYRAQAEALVGRIEQRVQAVLGAEQKRPFAEYSFFNVLENPLLPSPGVTFSPLSELPPDSDVPGIIGYFQIDPDGSFHSPVLPDSDNDSSDRDMPAFSQVEMSRRLTLRATLRRLLLAEPRTASDDSKQRAERGHGDAQAKRERADERELKQDAPAARLQRYALDELFQPPSESRRKVVGEPALDEAQVPVLRPAQEDRRVSESQLRALNINAGRMAAKQQSAQAAASAVAPLPASVNTSAAQYRRKEKVRIPDQAAARALFDRRQRKALASAPPAYKPGGVTAEAESDQASEAIRKKSVFAASANAERPVVILSFDSEIDRLQMVPLDSTYDCFFRRVWHDNGRYIQGFIVKRNAFLQDMVEAVFRRSAIASLSRLLIAYDGVVVKQLGPFADNTRASITRQDKPARPKKEELLLDRSWLNGPLQDVELLFSVAALPLGSGALLIDLTAVVLAVVLVVGLAGFYRLGVRHIQLAQQKGDFVSAVSHELKTPLTAIRMYSEILRSGWVPDEKKKRAYYDHIFFESERLSRLIANVLQLAKLENHGKALSLQPFEPAQLLQSVHHTLSAQVEASGFELNICQPASAPSGLIVEADADAFSQIMINLVDNALKFSAAAETRRIDVGWTVDRGEKKAVFFVRDYGPGIRRGQMKKIFRLFYRSGEEMTRTKPGTGIGLALVQQLAGQMYVRVDPINRQPGVEFRLRFPFHKN